MNNELRPLEPALHELLGFVDPLTQSEVIDTIEAAGRVLAQRSSPILTSRLWITPRWMVM